MRKTQCHWSTYGSLVDSVMLNRQFRFCRLDFNTILTGRYSQRFVSQDAAESDTTVPKQDTTKESDIFEAAIGGPSESRDFKAWYAQMKVNMTKSSNGPVYLGRSTPFPYNPEFRPPPPLADSVKESLFATWRSDPVEWTLRKLSIKYGISMERSKAIIKLKSIQTELEKNGFRINKVYLRAMERNIGAKTSSGVVESSSQASHKVAHYMPPKLVAIPEGQQISPEEAAKLLDRKLKPIYSMITEQLEGDTPYNPQPHAEEKMDVKSLSIRNDPYEKSRWRFVFFDTSKTSEPDNNNSKIYVRESDGTLRYAHERERFGKPTKDGRRVSSII